VNRDGAQVWYGPIGKDWQVRRFKHVARIVGGQVDPTDERYRDLPLYAPNHMQSGTGRLLSVGTAEEQAAESGKYLIGAGDILYSKIRPALRKVIVAPSDGLCSADVYGIRPANGELESRFLFYVLLSEGFYQYSLLESDRVAMPKINREALGECPLVFASASRQRRIADFLDRKTAAIDELIAKKERLVELLAEKCQALITQAVTKGLDPNVPMQDSGIGWIGAIPRHWTIARVKQVARLESGHTPSRSVPEHWLDTNDIPWVSLNDTKALARHDEISETTYYINQLGLQNSSARMLPARVVVFTRERQL
jgi:type I restriction enzyme S subunit